MSDVIAIKISGLSKAYSSEINGTSNEVLKDFSIDIRNGELLSIVGSNGSGKSTLLGLISGLIKPDKGSIEIHGKLVAILENGSNFHSDLTGIENAEMFFRLNGVLPQAIPELINKAKAFSGLEAFFEQPIKYYSQGMFVRLAVSVAFLIDADIYLFDEVLSVGDDAFKKKIEMLIQDFINKGKCIVFASHNKQEVVNYSNRTIWIEMGKLLMDGKPQVVMPAYAKFQRQRFEKDVDGTDLKNTNAVLSPKEGEDFIDLNFEQGLYANEDIEMKNIRITGEKGTRIYREEEIHFDFNLIKKKANYGISCLVKVRDEFDQSVFFSLSMYNSLEKDFGELTENYIGPLSFNCVLPKKFLASGTYFLSLFIGKNSANGPAYNERVYLFPKLIAFKVQSQDYEFVSDPEHFSVNPALNWNVKRSI